MDIRNVDLNLLVAFDALIAERSVSRAATRLHLSQPATSAVLAPVIPATAVKSLAVWPYWMARWT